VELNLFSLRVLLAVAKEKSFSSAAKALFLTQPAVSSQIRNLETYFQASLVIRAHSGKIELTDTGKIVCRYAEKFTTLREDLLREIETHIGKSIMEFRLGACHIAGAHLVAAAIKAFREENPTVQVSLRVTKSDEIIDGLLSGSLDVGIACSFPKNKFLDKKKFCEVPLTIFEANGGQKQHQRTVSIHNLISTPLIMREEGAGTRKVFEEFLGKHHLKLKQFQLITVSESDEAIKKLAMSGMGFSVLPNFIVEEELKKGQLGKVCLEEGEMSQTFFLIYRKQEAISNQQRDFFSFMLENQHDYK